MLIFIESIACGVRLVRLDRKYNTIQYNIIFVGNRRHKEVGGRTTLHDRGAGKRKNLRSHRKVDIKKVGFKGAFEREEIVWVRITREGR